MYREGKPGREAPWRLAVARGLFVTAALVLGGVLASAEAPQQPGPQVGVEEPLAKGASQPVEIVGLELREATPGTLVELEASGAFVWTTYRDAGDHLVIELPNSVPSPSLATVESSAGLVERLEVEAGGDDQRPVTRVVVVTRAAAEHSVVAEGRKLKVELLPTEEWVAPVAAERVAAVPETPEAVEEPVTATAVADQPAEVEEMIAAVPDRSEQSAAVGLPEIGQERIYEPTGVPATRLENVEVSTAGGGTSVQVLGDGDFYYSTFRLQTPERFVVDLIGVVNQAPLATIPVDGQLVKRVRVAQFKPQPELVSRVVVDLEPGASARVERLDDGLRILVGSSGSTTLVEDVAAAGFDAESIDEPDTETVVESSAVTWEDPEQDRADEMDEGMGAQERGALGANDLPGALAVQESPREAERIAQAEPAPEIQPGGLRGDVELTPQATSAFAREEPDRGAEAPGTPFPTQTLGGDQPIYQGEPMTLRLKDADIKDVLRSFAQISGLNIVVQPGVSGTVTVELTNVPWDQALEQILKINGLGYQLEGNIMRIAPISKLREEAEEQQRLRAAEALSIPLRTVIKRVSYSNASSVASILRQGGGASIMSQRGSVVVDERTNTLIIKELPSYMDTVIAVIENLDVPEPQVMIEARIIETTKRFSRTLGIQWGFQGVADAAHGNTTGLQFPNNIDAAGGVQLLTGGSNGFLDISMGNVLNTFRMDIVLQAAESEGLINILSAPRITTLNNEQASIQSGLQIPIQTVANNTVSVQFVNATLRLDVTPHVTAEGTVLMDINIQKREPQLAFAVVGATNAPIATKDARTRVIVRDGGTTVIGGIYEVSSDKGEDRVPGLANVPIIKHLFKNKRRNDENEELLIFITPRVIKL